ncbi:HECT-domain (ubiquitin-transferase) domain-containing protein [Phthorimaea operculella]|nr:HECT-domain (ubiquitin-transferase) domain-containing protein [Phthorimaea operculella]
MAAADANVMGSSSSERTCLGRRLKFEVGIGEELLLILKPTPEGSGPGGEFILDDGVQPSLELVSAERDLLAATFTQLLIANCGGEDTFKNKQDFFYSEIRKVHSRHPHDKIAIRVLRSELVRSSLKATKHFTVADWCKNFDVTFQGEQGVDWGGVRREWFSLLCAQLFDTKFGLFASFHDSPTGLVHPNPDRPPHLKLKHFELAGKLVGKCLYESALGGTYRQLVRARLTRSFLAQIIGLRVHYKYFEQDDPELYLSKIKYVLETDLDSAESVPEIYFAEDIYDSQGRLVETHDLIPNGASIRVRNSTKLQYLDALAQWRLATRCKAEMDAFLRGLTLLVPDNLLAIFDENQLELLVCGTGEVSVADWRAHALVSGCGRDWERLMSWFWAALANLTTEERARLLQFTTGCSQLPPGGFQELNPRFQITAAPSFGALPTAHTCFNQLCLPDYDSYEQLVHALLWAINEGGEGFGMI